MDGFDSNECKPQNWTKYVPKLETTDGNSLIIFIIMAWIYIMCVLCVVRWVRGKFLKESVSHILYRFIDY